MILRAVFSRAEEHVLAIRCAMRWFECPFRVLRVLYGRPRGPYHRIRLRTGETLNLRPFTGKGVSDLAILVENLFDDQYNLHRLQKKDAIIVDIGAHGGFFSVLSGSRCGGRVFAFEPASANYDLLTENVCANPKLDIKATHLAVSNRQGVKRLILSKTNSGAHSFFSDDAGSYENVECISLHDLIVGLPGNRIDLLKIDCEGGEFDVILGARDQDLACIDRIIMETHHSEYTKTYNLKDLLNRLRNCGFDVRVLKTTFYPDEGTFHIVSAVRADSAGDL